MNYSEPNSRILLQVFKNACLEKVSKLLLTNVYIKLKNIIQVFYKKLFPVKVLIATKPIKKSFKTFLFLESC